jgi:hypothetical protein
VGRLPDAQKAGRFGCMLYYRNRLVESFRTAELRHALDADDLGKLGRTGVVVIAEMGAVAEVSVVSNKDAFCATEGLDSVMNLFCGAVQQYLQIKQPAAGRSKLQREWIQCDRCAKWRTTTAAVLKSFANKEFVCSLNDAKHVTACYAPAEDFDSEAEVRPART